MESKTLYYGSPIIVQRPLFGYGKPYNDYGQGFYCTEHLDLAREWACTKGQDGYVNRYDMDLQRLRLLNLSDPQYTVLHWLALLMEHRTFRISTPVMKAGIEWLHSHFHIDLDEYDLVIGYRADDSYFSFARAFVNNEISLDQLSLAMRLGKLGEQFVLKSEKAFRQIHFVSSELVDNSIYYAKRKVRDEDARSAYRAQLEEMDLSGLYMRDIIREEVGPHDPRLR